MTDKEKEIKMLKVHLVIAFLKHHLAENLWDKMMSAAEYKVILFQIYAVSSQPYPRFKKGDSVTEYVDIVSKKLPEIIVDANGDEKIIPQ